MQLINVLFMSAYHVPRIVQKQLTAITPLSQSLLDAFKTGIITLFGKLVKLRHRKVKDLPEHTQKVSGRTGIQNRSI